MALLREATEFTSGEGPGIFRGGLDFFHPQSGGGARIFSPLVREGGLEFFHAWSGGDTFFSEHIFSKKCLK